MLVVSLFARCRAGGHTRHWPTCGSELVNVDRALALDDACAGHVVQRLLAGFGLRRGLAEEFGAREAHESALSLRSEPHNVQRLAAAYSLSAENRSMLKAKEACLEVALALQVSARARGVDLCCGGAHRRLCRVYKRHVPNARGEGNVRSRASRYETP